MADWSGGHKDLWVFELYYVNYSSLLLMHCISERNKVGYTLLYEATVLKYNFRCSIFKITIVHIKIVNYLKYNM